MADQKLSELASAGPINPTDITYLVQGITPTKASVAALQSGMTGPFPVHVSTLDPTTTDIPSGFWVVWRNSVTGITKLWANNTGTLVSVALA